MAYETTLWGRLAPAIHSFFVACKIADGKIPVLAARLKIDDRTVEATIETILDGRIFSPTGSVADNRISRSTTR